MVRKATVCLSLFTLLFVGAFSLERQLSREFYDPSGEEMGGMVQIQQLDDGTTLETINQKIFAPREYVKIISSDRQD